MATLDQLPPDSRAIIELVLQRGQSYEDLSDALAMPESRVREHAREALASLAPRTAERVDPQWRGQVADYVLGQQSGPQSKATRSHLKGSEAARTWALSVLDSVGHLYPGGAAPAIPAGGRSSEDGERPRERRAAAEGSRGERGKAAAPSAGKRAAPSAGKPPARKGAPLSAEARKLVRRRRVIAGVAGLLLVLAGVLLVTGVFTGGDEGADAGDETEAAQADPEVTSQVALEPVGNGNGAGAAIIAEREGQNVLLTRGRLPPLDRGEAYVVWLYNSPRDAVAVAVPQTDRRGNFQAVAPLPEDYEQYRSVDVSLQERSDRRDHSGNSLLRGPVAGTGGAGAAAPEGGIAPEGAVPPEGTELPDPGSLPTAPEGGG